MTVAIINYGLGNLRSVANAVEFVGGKAMIAQTPGDISSASHVILPGVGAFGDGMENLEKAGWVQAITEHAIAKQKPFLGLCLGMQLLAATGTEHGTRAGLGLIDATVVRMNPPDSKMVRIPHIGWNTVSIAKSCRMYEGIGDADFYFVHSYVMETADESVVSGRCDHGQNFIASVERGNVWGTQYHPEKSQKAGLKLIGNFLAC